MVIEYNVAVALTIGAIIGATLFRTYLPWFQAVIAEANLARREGRMAVRPPIDPIWSYLAGINFVLFGFGLLATMDAFVKPIMEATSPMVGFFVVWASVNLALEGMFRMADSALPSKPEESKTETTSPTTPP